MGEFDIVRRIRTVSGGSGRGIDLGIGDDAAVLELDRGERLVVTSDTLAAGVHFGEGDAAADIGYKALAVNLSDLAAMGATPRWCLLNLTLPSADPAWLEEFLQGFHELARTVDLALVGGDTTRGPLSITVTALGSLAGDGCLRRDGARAGDRVLVSGCIGEAALALRGDIAGAASRDLALRALLRPMPRVRLGQALRRLASACIDVSDGLLADLGHLCEASALGAAVYLDRLPVSAPLADLHEEDRWGLQLGGGDDYELCFCVPAQNLDKVMRLQSELGIPLTEIGVMEAGDRPRCLRGDGREFSPRSSGFDHFGAAG